jgi:hypothetical protein
MIRIDPDSRGEFERSPACDCWGLAALDSESQDSRQGIRDQEYPQFFGLHGSPIQIASKSLMQEMSHQERALDSNLEREIGTGREYISPLATFSQFVEQEVHAHLQLSTSQRISI